ncbi:MAG: hypothetical protein IPJ34_02060 [Myxococcales bacterium]|nr:hypothetical protein [Myxococcales bacterium]
MKIFAALAASMILGCGGSDPAPAAIDAGAEVATDTAPTFPKVIATVRYTGSKKGPLAVGVFTENPPKTKPPISFDTTNTPTFPYVAELRDIEPGKYWVVAVLDMPPVTPGAVVPGVEDLQASSVQIEVVAGKDVTTEVLLTDKGPADAGAD